MAERTDWVHWHDPYTNPDSPLSQRLEVVRRHVRGFLDEHTSAVPRIISICAGDGRDLIEAAARHTRARSVRATLVELDPHLVARARASAAAAGLDSVTVIRGDAAMTDVYEDAVPADLVIACGVFGNISNRDVHRTIESLPQLCAKDATVIWTRHRRPPDLTPCIRSWLDEVGFQEKAFDSPGPNAWSVGVHSFLGEPQLLEPRERLFTFIR